MSKYYEALKKEISWFNHNNEPIEIIEIQEFYLENKFQKLFPITTQLINKSNKTAIKFKGTSLVLFTWEFENKICGWLCQFDKPKIDLLDEHIILIENIGGIIESFNGPESIELNNINYNYTLNLNQNFMFVASLSDSEMDWTDYYLAQCTALNCKPIALTNKVFFTKEANGARYFYDKNTKEVTLFSHDHAFEFIKPLQDQPEYTMYKIQGVKVFNEFVELVANQWINYIDSK